MFQSVDKGAEIFKISALLHVKKQENSLKFQYFVI